ncbi:MoeA-like, domain I and II [Stappia aggregata IAM 12614]|uniref:Molybdopterin molybdenumtransferase n=1 Tax=Roseibium aggregatum (strain ATCC 25650 / DSM 13394 / JCM 20685 / NBRC 16684 / NCIMB 2208 / IAM 12614 / B1) TaxID=384765 RepID=A0NSY5_ROSAI|nr:gephyrin-like molybdotransferase Glp [Roseibium aggregatum]EAV44067.1 MoeA-like, domain I and II [Stappia aggregata IAM 12614] [Roseibium aggregatum IAM 12614]
MSLMPVSEALAKLLCAVEPLETEFVSLENANGRYLSEPLVSTRTQPPFAASAMDGYAIRHDDLTADGTTLTIIGEAPAGHGYSGTVGAGETVRIFTGAPVPAGADTILIQEDAARDGEQITVLENPAKGAYVRPAGLDFAEGDVLLKPPLKLAYRHLALAAAMNHALLPVHRRPKVAILATGDELVRPGTEPGPDQIIASNHAGIAALVEDCGGEPLDLGISPDEPVALANHVRRAIREKADILVTLGGASVGDHDLVQDILGQEGMDLAFWRIAMRPGKPLMAGRLGGTKVLGLPGNPVSSLVCGLLFLKPLIEAMLGQTQESSAPQRATLAGPLPENDRRQDYVRATLSTAEDGQLLVTPFSRQDSSMLNLLAKSGALVVRPPHAPALEAGAEVPILVL